MKFQIICKGSLTDGLGHLFRAKTFANEAQLYHDINVVAIVPEELENIFWDVTFDIYYVREDKEIELYVNSYKPDVILFDLLKLDKRTFINIKDIPKLKISLSPIFNQMEYMDLLFTRAINKPNIKGNIIIKNGLEYTIFSQYCQRIDDEVYYTNVRKKELSISICMGGTDASNKTLKILDKLYQLDFGLTIWVILGEGYAHSYNKLAQTAKGKYQHEVILAKTNRSMWKIISHTVLGIFAGGLTTMEAMYAGLPSINLVEKKVQKEIINEFVNKKYCLDSCMFSEEGLDKMINMIKSIYLDRYRLVEIRENLKGIIDRNASKRIINEIEEYFY